MKKFIKILLIIGIVVAVACVAFAGRLSWLSKQPAVKDGYYTTVNAALPLEQKYTVLGSYDVESKEYKSGESTYGTYKIWYPKEMENANISYPAVIMANGTGVPYTKYEPIFRHLASWGFIVIGNNDESSWDGVSSSKSLDFLFALNKDSTSPFYQKIDVNNVGIAGHSQGGVGVINAITNFDNSGLFKAAYTASTTHTLLATNLKWSYEMSKVSAPLFMTAGTGKTDAETIAPLSSLQENLTALNDDIPAMIARRKDTDHGEMLANADGYMTAWFMYFLKDDMEAKTIFYGDTAEISQNENWQDIQKQNLN